MKLTEKTWLYLILLLSFILRFVNLTAFDIKNDSALYSIRALGWFDYLGGGQTAPVQWFGSIPSWALISFHDCPPLVFLIQKISFIIFGDNTFAVRLPFALAGVLSVLVVYYAVKLFRSGTAALWAAGIFSLSSYAVWSSRAGYLEGVVVLFIILSVYFFLKYLKGKQAKNLYFWAAMCGLAFLSKYTSFFLLPVGLAYLFFLERRTIIKEWAKVAYAAGVFVLVISPVLIYNALVLKYRGHLDASLSAMIGLHPQDYSVIAARAINANIWDNCLAFLNCFFYTTSLPLLVLFAAAFVYLLLKLLRRRGVPAEWFIMLNLLAAWLMFCFGAPAIRQVSIAVPFLCIILALAWDDLQAYLSGRKKWLKNLCLALLLFALILEAGYCLNTNNLKKPQGAEPWFYSSQALQSDGWNQLESYWRENLFPSLPAKKKIRTLEDMPLTSAEISGKNVVFYDDNVNWFAYMWYIEKYPLYYRFPVLPLSYLLSQPNAIGDFKQLGAKGFYYVSNVSPRVTDASVSKNEQLMQAIAKFNEQLVNASITPYEIKNANGETTFKIYKLD